MTTLMKLIRKMRSPENKRVLEAIEEMRVRSWLTDGSLKNHRLCQVHMQGADLFEANLSKVDLHQANLEWADLSQANLRGARLTRVNLRSANFSQTQLSGADLLKADLGGARNLTDEQLSQVKRLCFAIMPNGATYDGRYNLQGDLDLARWQKVDVDDPEAMAYFYGVPLEVYLHAQGMEIQEA
ncbi:MAG: pentapeptide repeat-containing protein [Anaerolineaceae bacterium]|nr:MAG: pentapeptide repeat-containing protein [Anaerolineaceae bacterium]